MIFFGGGYVSRIPWENQGAEEKYFQESILNLDLF